MSSLSQSVQKLARPKAHIHGTPYFFLSRKSSKKLIIFVHGFPLSSRAYRTFASELNRYMNVLLIDLPGFGMSKRTIRKRNTQDFIEAIQDSVKHTHRFGSFRDIFLAGHSMGGYLVLESTAAVQDLLSGIIVIASKASSDTAKKKIDRMRLARKLQRRNAVDELLKNQLPRNGSLPAEEYSSIKQTMSSQRIAEIVKALRILAGRKSIFKSVSQLRVPIDLIVGDRDQDMLRESKRIKTRNLVSSLCIVKGAGHMITHEKPKKLAWLVKRFCDTQTG